MVRYVGTPRDADELRAELELAHAQLEAARAQVAAQRSSLVNAEFDALRAEIIAHQQAQTGTVATALTVSGVVAGIALAEKTVRLEMLLVLPLVLSGLGLYYLERSRASLRIGYYIGQKIWGPDVLSWESWINTYRAKRANISTHTVMGVLPGALIFLVRRSRCSR